MKTILYILFSLVIANTTIAQLPVNDFRGFTWGDPMLKVQAIEKAKFLLKTKNNVLQYKHQLAGAECNVIYTFNDNDKLVSGIYVFTRAYSDPQLPVQDFKKYVTLLTEK